MLLAVVIVPNHVIAKLQQDFTVIVIYLEFLAEHQLSLGIQIDEHFVKVVQDMVSLKLSQAVLYAPFRNDMWMVQLHSGSL